ncbi:phosphoinositide 3-kinase regulatory subunit 5-like isoform X3 [Oncorhynchus tshawytscha]|uniref:phosphoinositide 3-kinase regulatory subunit 5-like isoform X3 n=1 Tax=Oncorhynchus tshawytscha TaxID=74940 RepID=UPI000D0A2884|nr:phosphoinositide 3-kinase regulatory subunit 5-like isoform X3 [Oncorhynchus tshawytscha]
MRCLMSRWPHTFGDVVYVKATIKFTQHNCKYGDDLRWSTPRAQRTVCTMAWTGAFMAWATALPTHSPGTTPHFSSDSGVLQEACEVFHCFLSWPEPCCSASRHLLSLIQQELRVPGISFQRLVREEQGLTTTTNHSKTMTVLLMSLGKDVPPELMSVSEQLSGVCHSQRDTSITLIKHAFQAALGTKYPLQILHHALQLVTAEALETAAYTWDPDAARESPLQSLKGLVERICIPPPDCHTGPGNVHTLTLPLAKCHMYSWDKDNFDILKDIPQSELDGLPVFNLYRDKGEEDEETEEETIKNRYTDHRISTVSTCSKDYVLQLLPDLQLVCALHPVSDLQVRGEGGQGPGEWWQWDHLPCVSGPG